jgi:hypothetical protein
VTAARAAAIVVAAALATGGCTGKPAPGSSAVPSTRPSAARSTPQTAQLSAANPTARFTVDGGGTARLVRVVIVANNNPARQPVVLSVRVNGIDSGGVTPFPPDQPGSFTVALPPAAAEAVGRGGAVLDVTLAPIATGEPLRADVQLRVQAYLSS